MRWYEILKRFPHITTGVEVGVWQGDNAEKLLANNRDLFLFLVDQWKADDPLYVKSKDGKSKLNQKDFDHAMDMTLKRLKPYKDRYILIRKSSEKACRSFTEKEQFDFVFIDANHIYEAVKKDIEIWYPLVKTGGYICGHDYGVYAGVKKAVNEKFDNVEIGVDYTWFVKK